MKSSRPSGYPAEWDDELIPEGSLSAKPLSLNTSTYAPRLTVRHVGGDTREVIVEEATEDGSLHVRWPEGAGCYVVHVFRTVERRGFALLYRTSKSRFPLAWQAVDPEEARSLWRRMTGRAEAKKWIPPWMKGKQK
jgi:hypothetical protein